MPNKPIIAISNFLFVVCIVFAAGGYVRAEEEADHADHDHYSHSDKSVKHDGHGHDEHSDHSEEFLKFSWEKARHEGIELIAVEPAVIQEKQSCYD